MPSYTPRQYWRVLILDAVTASGTPATSVGMAFIDALQNQYGDNVFYTGGPTLTGAAGGWSGAIGNPSQVFVRPNSIGLDLQGVMTSSWKGTGFVQFQSSVPVWVDRLNWYNDGYQNPGWASSIEVYSSDDGTTWDLEWAATPDQATPPTNYFRPQIFRNPAPAPIPADIEYRSAGASTSLRYVIDPAESFSDAAGTVPAIEGDPVASIKLTGTGTTTLLLPPLGARPIFREAGINGRPYLEVAQGQWLGTVNLPQGTGLATVANPYAMVFAAQNFVPNSGGAVPFSNYASRGISKGYHALYPAAAAGSQSRLWTTIATMNQGTILSGSRTFGYMAIAQNLMGISIDDFYNVASPGPNNLPSSSDTNLEILKGGTLNTGQTFEGDFYGASIIIAPSRADLLRLALWSDGLFYGEFGRSASELVFAGEGSLRIVGKRPSLVIDAVVSPSAGSLLIYGPAPVVSSNEEIDVGPSSLVLSGYQPQIRKGISVKPGMDQLRIIGSEPLIFTESGAVASQLAAIALGAVTPVVRASQSALIALAEPPPPPTRASQLASIVLGEVVPDVRASQVAMVVLANASRCVTEDCQIWRIERRDGKVFRYTSLDRDLRYGGKIYKACGSLDPSASQNGATLGDTGSISLSGLITDDGISEAELFGGLFDDAFVTIDLVSWGDLTQPPRRLASGWVGKVSHGPAFHTMEVLSVGARLEQVALVQVVSPSCRWKFGSPQCGVDVEAMKITGSVSRVINRGDIILTVTPPADDGRIWLNGRLRFVDGPCAGIVAEFKSIDFATGQIILWTPAGLTPLPGDAVEILPGCDLTKDGGCKAYSNIINFGGFPDVPGADAILEAPDAKM